MAVRKADAALPMERRLVPPKDGRVQCFPAANGRELAYAAQVPLGVPKSGPRDAAAQGYLEMGFAQVNI
jgi:hypothetical protein